MINAPHLTIAHEPELDHCIQQTYRGQAGWAGWKAPDKMCAECCHFRPGARQKHEGHCALYRERMAKDSAFRKFPVSAKACREFAPPTSSPAATKWLDTQTKT